MEQVLLNLFVNAWQAMPGGGDLFLKTENIILNESFVRAYDIEPGRYIKISVRDTGIGMDEKTRQRLFEPFFTTKEMGLVRGTGLGLASVYGIIRGHKGIINVHSEIGQGATFNIYLPASSRQAIRQDQISKEALRGNETILLVDDEENVTNVMSAMIKELGYQVIVACGGEEAVEIYRRMYGSIDLVIMDMIMPGCGGGAAIDQINAINPSVRVILSSGYSLDGEAQEIMNRGGVSSFIQKPFQLGELSRKIRATLEK